MKKFFYLISSLICVYHIPTQVLSQNYEIIELANNYSLVEVKAPNGPYSSFLYNGKISNMEVDAFLQPEMSIPQNNRDNIEEVINLGILPSDILCDSSSEQIIVYGGNMIDVLDGDNHSNVVKSFVLDNSVSNHNMAFMPISPYRYQLAMYHQDLFCASEGGKLFIINMSGNPEEIEIIQEFSGVQDAALISSSVQTDPSGNYILWVLNY